MRPFHAALGVFALVTPAAAQSAVLIAATPLVVTAQSGMQTQTNSLPSGLLGPFTNLGATASPSAASANLQATVGGQQHGLGADFSIACYVAASGASASVAPCDLLLAFANPTPAAATLTLSREVAGPAGAPMPQVRVDIHDDGTFEFTEQGSPGPYSQPLQLGPVPLTLRVRLSASSTIPGILAARLLVTVTPTNPIVVSAFGQCTLFDYAVMPRFDGDLDFLAVPPSSTTPVAVAFGLGLQPMLLGTTAAGPCLLLPRPDIALLGPFPSVRTLHIPAALRPLHLWTQAVMPMGSMFGTSQAFSVLAL